MIIFNIKSLKLHLIQNIINANNSYIKLQNICNKNNSRSKNSMLEDIISPNNSYEDI